MKVECKEFWEKVKREYSPTVHYELCNNSKTFKKEWDLHDEQIKIIAAEFLNDTKITGVHIGISWLFLRSDKKIEIRKQFIDYCIQKYS